MRFLALSMVLIGTVFGDTRLYDEARKLAETGLPYLYGASEIEDGGLDCSGFVRLAAKRAYGVVLPPEAGMQLEYVRQYGKVWDKNSKDWTPRTLQPGDLIFWTGTHTCPRLSPVTHVMIYMGNFKIAGAQSLGHRIPQMDAGVGFYPFRAHYPEGDLQIQDDQIYREKMTLYAYGRLLPPNLPKK